MAKLQSTHVYGTLITDSDITALGQVIATGAVSGQQFTATSDERVKMNINNIENALDIVDELRGVTFNWIASGQPSAGLIAQDVEKHLPELVITNAQGIKSLNYDGVIGILLEAIKELKNEVKELREKSGE
jgi:hypothetical protein